MLAVSACLSGICNLAASDPYHFDLYRHQAVHSFGNRNRAQKVGSKMGEI
jgi:hypothetical protein